MLNVIVDQVIDYKPLLQNEQNNRKELWLELFIFNLIFFDVSS